jgi:hypothetical protein
MVSGFFPLLDVRRHLPADIQIFVYVAITQRELPNIPVWLSSTAKIDICVSILMILYPYGSSALMGLIIIAFFCFAPEFALFSRHLAFHLASPTAFCAVVPGLTIEKVCGLAFLPIWGTVAGAWEML